ncbi:MAG: hypothetical protein K0B14_18305 [Anaerolineaceae bacterium]|nr:hypothetical protein [Anaerolineaceae bacterium]
MASINSFFKSDVEKELLIGTYLFPYVLFTGYHHDNPYSATEIIAEIVIDDQKILVTRNGGLFSKPLEEFTDILVSETFLENDIELKLHFEDKFVRCANVVICEFCLAGIVSEPITQVHVSRAGLIDNHALITSGGGGRETYHHRTLYASYQLVNQLWLFNRIVSMEKLSQVANVEYSSQLQKVSKNLPEFVASAYYNYSTQNISEALLDSWIVVEQIIDYLWGKLVKKLSDSQRRKRLRDTRTYSSAVRVEILFLDEEISEQEYDIFQKARKRRNELAHRAHISLDYATEGMVAMKLAIEHIIQSEIADPATARGISW